MASLPHLDIYTGTGPVADFSNAADWSTGVAATGINTALFLQSAIINGPVTVGTLMLVGSETMSINGAITTDSTNPCESFMCCQDSNATFNAGSTLADAGGFVVGVHGQGTVTIAGASGGMAAATVHMQDMQIGQFWKGVGTVTVAGNVVDAGPTLVGVQGNGTLNLVGTGTEVSQGFGVGVWGQGVGHVTLSGSSVLTANAWMQIGDATPTTVGGVGTVTVSDSAVLWSKNLASVGTGSAVNLAGGTFNTGALVINKGAQVSGYGALNSASPTINDMGVIASAGGKLVVTGNVYGTGAIQVGTGSTLDLAASKISVPTIAFMGSSGTLELSNQVSGAFSITGFQAGDQLLMAGVDSAAWNGTTDVLTLSGQGHVVDHLTLVGVAANAQFSVTPGIGGGLIALAPAHH